MCFDRRQLYVKKHRLIILFFYLRGLWLSMTAWAFCFWFILISDLLSVIVAVLEDAGQRGGAWFIAADKTVFLACFSGAGGAKDAEMEGCCWAEQAEGWGRRQQDTDISGRKDHTEVLGCFWVFFILFFILFYFFQRISPALSEGDFGCVRLRRVAGGCDDVMLHCWIDGLWNLILCREQGALGGLTGNKAPDRNAVFTLAGRCCWTQSDRKLQQM